MLSIALTSAERKELIVGMKRERKPSRRLRMHIVLLTSDGHRPARIARVLYCSRTTVYAVAYRLALIYLAQKRGCGSLAKDKRLLCIRLAFG